MRFAAESSLSPSLVQVLKTVNRDLACIASDKFSSEKELLDMINSAADNLGFELNNIERDQLINYFEDSKQDFGILKVLIDDPEVNDIIVTAYDKVTVQKGRKNFSTKLKFPDQEIYRSFVESLLSRAGTSYSVKLPIVDAMVDGWLRIHAVHETLCSDGPYLTIRINRFAKITTDDLLTKSLAHRSVLSYLSAIIHAGNTVLIAGEVGSGKTTLSRALAAEIPDLESVLVIEDTPEIELEHPQVRYIRTRAANIEDAGRISPASCIRAGMRMAMNRIIFGEIRDAEAAESFIDVCASGHPGLSTIHAKSVGDTVARLKLFLGRSQKGVCTSVLDQQIVNAVQVVVHIGVCPDTGIRRIQEVTEICGYADQQVRKNIIFKYHCQNNNPRWLIKSHLSYHLQEKDSALLAVLPEYLEI